ncbi:type VI secretion protein VasK [Enterobacteriaceae bacterium 4M9]|nr:type VI secretion protein VasK [Enterobacteriaceae bacterium 4M9]
MIGSLALISALVLFFCLDKLIAIGITKEAAWVTWGCIWGILLLIGIIHFSWAQHKTRQEQNIYQPELITGESPSPSAVTTSGEELSIQKDIRSHLKRQYGFFWFRKINILLITGSISDVEQLAPGLTNQRWQDDRGTLLLWGGDPTQPTDEPWLRALRKLRWRPADGLVWVTSALATRPQSGFTAPVLSEATMDTLIRGIHHRYTLLGWKLPLYLWSLQPHTGQQDSAVTEPVACILPARCLPKQLENELLTLMPLLTHSGVRQICGDIRHNFLLRLAELLSSQSGHIADTLGAMLNPYRPLPLAALVFSPPSSTGTPGPHRWKKDRRWAALPEHLSALPVGLRPRRDRFSWMRGAGVATAVLMMLWGAAMIVSFAVNRSQVVQTQVPLRQLNEPGKSDTVRLQALADLQDIMGRLQHRETHGTPWYMRAGLDQNTALLHALRIRYDSSARPLLRDAAAVHLHQALSAWMALPPDSPQRDAQAKAAYDRLKLYLMLARPDHMDTPWFSDTLIQLWPQRPGVPDGFWRGTGPSLLSFYAASLAAQPKGAVKADDHLVAQVRTLLVRQMGRRNSESTLYQTMLSTVINQFADLRLVDMTGDTDAAALFSTDEVVPGVFTRQAWEEAIQPAIDKVVSSRREEMDWVLSDSSAVTQPESSPDALRARLTERYFADYSGAWLSFLNSLRLQRPATLSDAIDQLTLMADVRQSPLVALMNTLSIQGRTGQTGEALSDSLVKSAKNLLGRSKQPAIDQSTGAHGPLDATFGPVLALIDGRQGAGSNLSLQTYLTRVTQVRLRLQQVTNAADPQAMTQTLAQTVFQGKAVDLTETRDYGSLVAAGLGQEWSGFGQTVFVRPMEQAWQHVLMPAAESLNAQWRMAVVDEWNRAFGGRYPFKNVSSEVSLPLLARYLNADTGRITQFLQGRLGGVLHREGSRWVPDSINAQGLNINPAFLSAVNTLGNISDVVFTRGEAGLHFELRPGTAAGIVETHLVIDSQKLAYMNQMPAWKRFAWPGDTEAPGATLSWVSSQAGTRQYADLPGAWGLIRLLDTAEVSAYPGVSSSWRLSWPAQDGRMLNYTLRTEAGKGPLELLRLRNFILPDSIFTINPSALAVVAGEDSDDVDTML